MRKNSLFNVKYEKESKESTLSSYGGAPIFLEFLKGIGFDRMIAERFKTKSKQGFHPVHNIFAIVLLNILGGESISDICMLQNDSGLIRFLNRCKHSLLGFSGRIFRKKNCGLIPSATTLFTFLNSFKSDKEEEERESTLKGKSKILPTGDRLSQLKGINRDILSVAQELDKQETATLDMDNNIINTNKKNAKVSYKGSKSYQPFNVYWFEQDLMVHSEFRDGNVPPGYEQMRVLDDALKQLPDSVKTVQVRSDSAGYQHEYLEYMESGKSRFGRIEFAVSADVTKSFRAEVLATKEEAWTRVVVKDSEGNLIETNHEVAEICFVPETKNKSKHAPVFRYIATREATDIQMEFTDEGQMTFKTSENAEKKLHLEVFNDVAYKIFGIVTNKSESPLEVLLWHRQRCGKSEQEHSRLTKDLAGGRFPSCSFGPNAAWWQLAIISLNLLKLFQRRALPSGFKGSRIKTLNKFLFHIAIKVVKSSNGLVVKIGKDLALYSITQFAQRQIIKIKRALDESGIWLRTSSMTS